MIGLMVEILPVSYMSQKLFSVLIVRLGQLLMLHIYISPLEPCHHEKFIKKDFELRGWRYSHALELALGTPTDHLAHLS